MSYPIPSNGVETRLEVKKSRFITRAAMAANRSAAMAALEQARRDYPDARHHCWAYLLGDPQQPGSLAMSDDGEPSGTAGKPILNVLQHSGMGDLVVVVIRYFGGIKLGAGGLVRAYAGAAESVLSAVPRAVQQPMMNATVTMDFADEQALRHWCNVHDGVVESVDYGPTVSARVSMPEHRVADFTAFCDAQKLDYGFDR